MLVSMPPLMNPVALEGENSSLQRSCTTAAPGRGVGAGTGAGGGGRGVGGGDSAGGGEGGDGGCDSRSSVCCVNLIAANGCDEASAAVAHLLSCLQERSMPPCIACQFSATMWFFRRPFVVDCWLDCFYGQQKDAEHAQQPSYHD